MPSTTQPKHSCASAALSFMLKFVSFACNGSKLCACCTSCSRMKKVKKKAWAEIASFPDLLWGRCLCSFRTRALSSVHQSPCSCTPFYCCAATLISVLKWVLSYLSPRTSVHHWSPDVYARDLWKRRHWSAVMPFVICELVRHASDWCYQGTALLCLFISEFESSEVIKLTRVFVAQTVEEQEFVLWSWANDLKYLCLIPPTCENTNNVISQTPRF